MDKGQTIHTYIPYWLVSVVLFEAASGCHEFGYKSQRDNTVMLYLYGFSIDALLKNKLSPEYKIWRHNTKTLLKKERRHKVKSSDYYFTKLSFPVLSDLSSDLFC